jgi:hypothetical protein
MCHKALCYQLVVCHRTATSACSLRTRAVPRATCLRPSPLVSSCDAQARWGRLPVHQPGRWHHSSPPPPPPPRRRRCCCWRPTAAPTRPPRTALTPTPTSPRAGTSPQPLLCRRRTSSPGEPAAVWRSTAMGRCCFSRGVQLQLRTCTCARKFDKCCAARQQQAPGAMPGMRQPALLALRPPSNGRTVTSHTATACAGRSAPCRRRCRR